MGSGMRSSLNEMESSLNEMEVWVGVGAKEGASAVPGTAPAALNVDGYMGDCGYEYWVVGDDSTGNGNEVGEEWWDGVEKGKEGSATMPPFGVLVVLWA